MLLLRQGVAAVSFVCITNSFCYEKVARMDIFSLSVPRVFSPIDDLMKKLVHASEGDARQRS